MKTSIGPGQPSLAPTLATAADFSIQSVLASFDRGNGLLTVFGDNLDNNTAISRDAAGQILINGGQVPVTGGTPTVANVAQIQVFGQGGNDTITLSEVNGALPAANLFGGAGNDAITGGSGGDLLFGQAGNDTLFGKGGNDFLFGGSENDTLTGGDGNDQVFGEAGDDRLIWNPGDDTDLFEGGAGTDTAEVNGGNGDEVFTITANGTRVRIDRTEPAPFAIDAGAIERFVINANGGDDRISATGNVAALGSFTLDGGAGNDTLLGGNGNDLLLGGEGNDFIDGNQGNDTALMGAGDDVFLWNPGDGNDTVEGQDGSDTLRMEGSAGNENFELSANGGRVRLIRNIANIVMDINDVEHIEIAARGGADNVRIGDLRGTDVQQVTVHLAGLLDNTAGDAQADTVRIGADNGVNAIEVLSNGSGGGVAMVGLPAVVNITGAEAIDRVVIEAGGGDDTIVAGTVAAGSAALTLDGGAGNDTLLGSRNADVLIGGDGNDGISGGQGNDVALLGAGDDRFIWNFGDGNDTVDGEAGRDTLEFNGSGAAESVSLAANGTHARLLRDVSNVNLDLNGVEQIDIAVGHGADTVTIGDLGGTGVQVVRVGLVGAGGVADGNADNVLVAGGAAADTVRVQTTGGEHAVNGLAAQTRIHGADAQDSLRIQAGAGDDVVDASGFAANAMRLTLEGSLGADTITGSAGNDVLVGGDGNDRLLGGDGDDHFTWSAGDDSDTIDGQAGQDTIEFTTGNVGENINLSAAAGHVRLARDVGAVNLDIDGVETLLIQVQGGADRVVVDDLGGTDLRELRLHLGTDQAVDRIVVNGSQGSDRVKLSQSGSDLVIDGLATRVVLQNFEFGVDTLTFNGLGGDDVIDASALGANAGVLLTGGAGDDVLFGGAAADTLRGDEGIDVLVGGSGNDFLDGGLGEDVLIGGPGTDTLVNGEVNTQSAALLV